VDIDVIGPRPLASVAMPAPWPPPQHLPGVDPVQLPAVSSTAPMASRHA